MKTKPSFLTCKCGADNELSKVDHDKGYVSYAELECSKTGFKRIYGVKR